MENIDDQIADIYDSIPKLPSQFCETVISNNSGSNSITSIFSDNAIIQMHENMDSPYGKKKTVQYETEVLISLIKKFELNKMEKFDPKRNIVWTQITNEFNSVTGNNWNLKKLSNKWKNYGKALRDLITKNSRIWSSC